MTLIEDHEFRLLGVENFASEIRSLGLDWIHLPIRDADVPDLRFEAAWVVSGRLLHERLDAGDRILIHCRGGLGRTGLVAGRILVERGCDPLTAINRVRAVRATRSVGPSAHHVAKAHQRQLQRFARRPEMSLIKRCCRSSCIRV